MSIKKYFWDLNERAQKDTINKVLKDPDHPKYLSRIHTLLSRCDRPGEVFLFIGKEQFIDTWPDIRKYWKRSAYAIDFLAWWETVYEQLIEKSTPGKPLKTLIEIGENIRKARIERGMSQNELAGISHIKQPDISKMENGQINITIETLYKLLTILKVKHLKIDL